MVPCAPAAPAPSRLLAHLADGAAAPSGNEQQCIVSLGLWCAIAQPSSTATAYKTCECLGLQLMALAVSRTPALLHQQITRIERLPHSSSSGVILWSSQKPSVNVIIMLHALYCMQAPQSRLLVEPPEQAVVFQRRRLTIFGLVRTCLVALKACHHSPLQNLLI